MAGFFSSPPKPKPPPPVPTPAAIGSEAAANLKKVSERQGFIATVLNRSRRTGSAGGAGQETVG